MPKWSSVLPIFFNLSLNFAIRSWWSEPQSAPGLVFTDCIELLHLWLQGTLSVWFWYYHLVMSMCRVFSCCWKKCTCYDQCVLLTNSVSLCLLHFVLQGQTCLLFQVCLGFLLVHSNPLWWKGHLFLVLVLEDVVGLCRTCQVQLLQHYCLGHRFGLPWYWMVFLEMNRDHFVIFETVPKYCTSDSFVDHDG